METTEAFTGLECRDCEASIGVGASARRCPECNGLLDPTYAYAEIDLDRATLDSREFDSLWRYEEVLPFPKTSAVSMAEGATALIECPTLAEAFGVDRVYVKDEGRNPTGSMADRGASLALTAVAGRGESAVSLPSTGDSAQAVAAYAGRAGIDAHAFLPARSTHTTKSMVNVHGAEMTVSGGRFDETAAAWGEEMAAHEEWHSLAPFDTPFRHEAAKTVLFEVLEQLSWTVPDAIVYPTGHGIGLVGGHNGAMEFEELGLIDERPTLYAAQAAGCSPVVEAYDAGRDSHTPVEHPDTICGAIEIPDPAAGSWILEALEASGGGAVATEDETILEAAVTIAYHEGIELSPAGAAAASATRELADQGTFDEDDVIVLVNPGSGTKEADILRSHLMRTGV